MRFLFPLFAVSVICCTAADSTVLNAQADVDRTRALANIGAVARVQVDAAEDRLADTRDMALLNDGLTKPDMTGAQSDEMVAAAKRCLERRQKRLDKMRGLVDAGLAAANELEPALQDVLFASREYELAQSCARIARDLAELERSSQALREHSGDRIGSLHYAGSGLFTAADLTGVEAAFTSQFDKPLPISALGETATHRALGFDHRGRVDVALAPDQPEGAWLLRYLESRRIPYFAFRYAMPGKATGPHIHIGPESTRLQHGVVAD